MVSSSSYIFDPPLTPLAHAMGMEKWAEPNQTQRRHCRCRRRRRFRVMTVLITLYLSSD